jgi:hypothetical protein
MSMPYLTTVSPTAILRSATLWPMGMSCLAVTEVILSSSMIQPLSFMPAFTPSTTTTATLSCVVQHEMNHRMLLFGPRVRRGQRGTIAGNASASTKSSR